MTSLQTRGADSFMGLLGRNLLAHQNGKGNQASQTPVSLGLTVPDEDRVAADEIIDIYACSPLGEDCSLSALPFFNWNPDGPRRGEKGSSYGLFETSQEGGEVRSRFEQ